MSETGADKGALTIKSNFETIEFAGRCINLLAEKAAFLPDSATLLVADIHLGKAASFRARNFFAPEGMGVFDLNRLTALIEDCAARRLVILGDMIHAPDGLKSASLETFSQWRRSHGDIKIILVLGNHDLKMNQAERRKLLFDEWQVEAKEELVEFPFVFAHDPLAKSKVKKGTDSSKLLRIGGHIHPCVSLSGKGKQSERLPCFWMSAENTALVLPAFGSFTGTYTITPEKNDKIFAIAHDTVIELNFKK